MSELKDRFESTEHDTDADGVIRVGVSENQYKDGRYMVCVARFETLESVGLHGSNGMGSGKHGLLSPDQARELADAVREYLNGRDAFDFTETDVSDLRTIETEVVCGGD